MLDSKSGPHPDEIDYDTRDGEIARRNILFGLWAGRRMGMSGDALEAYAWSVHFADHHAPGHDDVVAKVAADFTASGMPMNDQQARDRLREMTIRASLDLAQGDRDAATGASSRAIRPTNKPQRNSMRHFAKVDRRKQSYGTQRGCNDG